MIGYLCDEYFTKKTALVSLNALFERQIMLIPNPNDANCK